MANSFLISTGGSGGHVIPATILYEHLSKDTNVILSTDERGLNFLNKDFFKLVVINTPKLNNFLLLPFNILKIIILTIKSFFFLKNNQINKILSTGGYMSMPIIFAARLLRLKIYLVEPNQVLGRANKFFLNSCEKIFCYSDQIKNFPDDLKYKIVIIDPLVSKNTYKLNSNPVAKKNKFTILVVGGSQGAYIFDQNLKNSILDISKKNPIKIIQQTHIKNVSKLSEFYNKYNIENKIFSFDNNFAKIIHQSDLCITRAGASTLAELSLMNIPFIAVPLPTSKDNHQFENANFYKNKDCCWIIDQKDFEKKIGEYLSNIIKNKNKYLKIKENLKKLNFQNTWINVNQKILKNINEN